MKHEAAKSLDVRATRGTQTKSIAHLAAFAHFALRGLRASHPRLRAPHRHILHAMRHGATLKVHRTLDGAKTHILQPLTGPAEPVDRAAVEYLRRCGLIASNMKFPAATYMLTERGIAVATES